MVAGVDVEVLEVVGDSVGNVLVVEVVVAVVPNCGRVNASNGALFGQYLDGYPN